MKLSSAIMTISSMTMLSRLAGFVRDTLMAAFVGTGPVADAFFVAQRLPNLFRGLFAEGAFSASFVPLYASVQTRDGEAEAKRFSGETLAMLLLILIPASALIIIAMPWVMLLLAPGFTKEPEKFAMAVFFSRITFPYLLLVSVTALQGSVLNARNHFAPSAFAPVLYNLVLIGMMLAAVSTESHIGEWLAWSVTIAGVVQSLWLFSQCKKYGLVIPLMRPQMTERVKRMFKQIGPGALGAGATQVNLAISTVLASTLPSGAVSYLFYADRLYQLPLGVIGIAVSTALLPILSSALAKNDEASVTNNFSRAIEFGLAMGLPASIGLMLLAHPIIQTLFERGAFGPEATHATAMALTAYAMSVAPYLLIKIISQMFFARHDTKTPVNIALIAIASNIALALCLLPSLGHVGIALATGCATWINLILLYVTMRKRFGIPVDDRCQKRIPKILLCTIAMAVVTLALSHVSKDVFATRILLYEILALAGLLVAAMATFFGLGQWLKAWQLQDLFDLMKQSRAVSKDTSTPTDSA